MLPVDCAGKGLLESDVITFSDHRPRGALQEQAGGLRDRLMKRMTLRRLEVFVAVVEAGGFRACSDLMDISSAAVSHHINQLEEEIGYRLFVRQRGRVGNLT